MRAVYKSGALAQELPPTSNATRPWPLGQLRFAQYKTRNDKTLVQATAKRDSGNKSYPAI
jgi:hypothetical protein